MGLIYSRMATETSLHGLVGARFLTLSPRARTIVGCAALLGYRFDLPLLTAAMRCSMGVVLEALRRAQRLDLIVLGEAEADTRYRFRHNLTQAAIRRQLRPALRRALHGMIAAALETAPDAMSCAERLAYHWTNAGNAERAAFHGRRAACDARLLGL